LTTLNGYLPTLDRLTVYPCLACCQEKGKARGFERRSDLVRHLNYSHTLSHREILSIKQNIGRFQKLVESGFVKCWIIQESKKEGVRK
jgi:hypothetical protein